MHSAGASGSFCSRSPASSSLQSHPIPSLSPAPVPAAATTKYLRLTFARVLFGVGWRGQPSGTSRGFSCCFQEPGPVGLVGGCSHLPATPLSSCLVIPRGMSAGWHSQAALGSQQRL